MKQYISNYLSQGGGKEGVHGKHHGALLCRKVSPCVALGRFGIKIKFGKAS